MTRRIREIVVSQLRQYKNSCAILKVISEDTAETKQVKGWILAIEKTQAMLQRDAPHKAQLMELLFFADTGDTPSDSCARRELLLDELHISEPTLYRWRNDIINAVIVGAVEVGALSVYGPLAGEGGA